MADNPTIRKTIRWSTPLTSSNKSILRTIIRATAPLNTISPPLRLPLLLALLPRILKSELKVELIWPLSRRVGLLAVGIISRLEVVVFVFFFIGHVTLTEIGRSARFGSVDLGIVLCAFAGVGEDFVGGINLWW